jgi:hypothetical protein
MFIATLILMIARPVGAQLLTFRSSGARKTSKLASYKHSAPTELK